MAVFDSANLPRGLLGCAGLLLLVAVVILGGVYWPDRITPSPSLQAPGAMTRMVEDPPAAPLPGEQILASYGKPDTRPEEDLSMMAHAFSNLTLLIKGDAPFRMGANEEFAAALRGKNRDSLRFLPDLHPCFNAQGQIVDRWKTPLFFHVNDRDHIDIRSAGPDRVMATDDDLHRRYDGQFLHGRELNARSLDEAGRSPMSR